LGEVCKKCKLVRIHKVRQRRVRNGVKTDRPPGYEYHAPGHGIVGVGPNQMPECK